MICAGAVSAQNGCGPEWLKEQRGRSMTQPPFEDYLGARVRSLHHTEYFTAVSDYDRVVRLTFQAGRNYTVLYYTTPDAMASGIELLDPSGMRMQFHKVYGKSVNNWLELTYESARAGTFDLVARSIFPLDRSSCAVVLVREYDDAQWKERLRDMDDEPQRTGDSSQ